MLPDIDGFEICTYIRQKYTYPIIMLTAKNSDLDHINGLTLGADDYVNKPFNTLELIARVKAQLRRYKLYDGNTSKENYYDRFQGFLKKNKTLILDFVYYLEVRKIKK